MKINKTITSLLSLAAVATLAFADGGTISEESLGLRKTDLYSESKATPEKGDFSAKAAGTSERFERAFVNAPPMIPHDTTGMLPITRKNNACLGCHMPAVAKGVGATPIPPSHFTNFRPDTKIAKDGSIVKEGKSVSNTSDFKTVAKSQKKLYQGRFNCSQCHAPQANIKPLVKNNFTPDFKDDKLKKKSNLIDVINEGVDVK
jgi:cytochrome c-type protein NapB